MWKIKFSGIEIQINADSIEDLKNKILQSKKLTEAKIYDQTGRHIYVFSKGEFKEVFDSLN